VADLGELEATGHTERELGADRLRVSVSSPDLTVSVVICAYTEKRWDTLVAAVRSVRDQLHRADQLLIVVDHNPNLLRRAAEAFPEAEVVANLAETRGIAGARNSGVHHNRCSVIAYLDDDAIAEPQWLQELLSPYENPPVIGTGSQIEPSWTGQKPSWFPEEFGWVLGCSYRGQPNEVAPVRNFIANGMSLRKEAFDKAGLFLTDIGRIGDVPLGCEETELCIRVGNHFPDHVLLHVPTARVHHDVPASRLTVRYFLVRCFAEGLSKDAVSRHVGAGPALSTEREYTLKVLPRGIARSLRKAARGDPSGAAEALMIITGLIATIAGYIGGRTRVFAKVTSIWGDRRIRGRNQPKSVAPFD
jgi:GT2 family glycosyltransferase